MREKLFSDFSEEKPQMMFTSQREYYMNSSRLKISHGRRNEIRLINNFGFRHKQARKVFITRETVFGEPSWKTAPKKGKLFMTKAARRIFLSIFTRKEEAKVEERRFPLAFVSCWGISGMLLASKNKSRLAHIALRRSPSCIHGQVLSRFKIDSRINWL